MSSFFRKKFYFVRLALSEFHVHKKRFSLTAIAIAWGTCTILLMLGFGEGLKNGIAEMRYAVGENVILIWGGRTSKPYKGLPAGRQIKLDKNDIDFVREKITGIKSISGAYRNRSIEAAVGINKSLISLYGTEPSYGESRNLNAARGGRFINAQDIAEKRRVIFMGAAVAKKFYPKGAAVGQDIIINNVPFKIIGVLESLVRSGGFGSRDDEKTYIPASTYEALFGDVYFNHIMMAINNPAESEDIQEELYYLLGSKFVFDPTDKGSLRMWETVRMIRRYSKMSIALQFIMLSVGSLTLLISGVGLANIMYASITRRTREIGIKIALGAHPRQVLWQIVSEAFGFSIAGGLLGGGLAILIAEFLRGLKIENQALQFLANPSISLQVCIITTTALAIITFLAGFFPARKAALQNPIESLRYE